LSFNVLLAFFFQTEPYAPQKKRTFPIERTKLRIYFGFQSSISEAVLNFSAKIFAGIKNIDFPFACYGSFQHPKCHVEKL